MSGALRGVGVWLLMAAIFGVSFTVSAAQVGPRTGSASANIVAERDFGSWKYVATKEQNGVAIAVELTQKDHKGLKSYMLANAQLATQLFQQHPSLEGRVVFKRPAQEQDLPKTIQSAQSQVKGYELRVRGGKNEKFTVFGVPSTSSFLPQDLLTPMLADIATKSGRADLKGFTTITMSMSAAQYQELIAAPNVLFVDIAPAAAVDDYQQSLSSSTGAESITTSPAPAYWYQEETIEP